MALAFPEPDQLEEATGDSAHRRAQRANRAAQDVLTDRTRTERAAVKTLHDRLTTLQQHLRVRVLADTDFRRFNTTALAADVDRMIADTQQQVAQDAKRVYDQMADLGDLAADEPMRAAQLRIVPALPGLDATLVTAAFDNTVDLLTQPMQQFGTDVKVALRRVALAGDNKFAEIARLRDQISGQGFDNAQYRAERIIRTELGRVFTQATHDRLMALFQDFPFLRKGWRAATDNRTRLGHREAGKAYARGSGIPIPDRFQIKVYDERKSGQVTLLGLATLRFPIDPQAQPAGRLSAAATIMCRCSSFVDFDMADFAQFTARQIQLALGGPLPPVAPGPTRVNPPLPAPPSRPRTRRTRTPKAVAGQGVPATVGRYQPGGTPVSAALNLNAPSLTMSAANQAKVQRALNLIDRVHGDGNLPTLSVKTISPRHTRAGLLAYYARTMANTPLELGFGTKALRSHPHMSTFHETGHFLDHVGFDGDRHAFSSESDPGFEAWRTAAKNSQAIQMLQTWHTRGTPGDNITPASVNQRQIAYMLSTKETWARAYAQWVAVKSQDPAALKELRHMQRASQIGPVPATRRYNAKLPGTLPNADTWDYPWAWQDADFTAIEAAIDTIMERIGWRTKTTTK